MKINWQDRKYREDLEIDPNDLEHEWLTQPSIFMYYSEAYAEAIYNRDKAKQKMELTEAELDSYYLSNWERYFEKVPSDKVRSVKVINDQKYQKALDLLNQSNYKLNLLQSVKSAFEHRKKALEQIVTMKVTGIHSDPKIRIREGVQIGISTKAKLTMSKIKK